MYLTISVFIYGIISITLFRSEKQNKEEIIKNTCFICGLERRAFDNKNVTFEEHIRKEHNMWHYLSFIILIKVSIYLFFYLHIYLYLPFYLSKEIYAPIYKYLFIY